LVNEITNNMKLLYTVILNILFVTCAAQVKKDTLKYGEWMFEFHNYDKEITTLPNEFLEITNISIYLDPCLFYLRELFNCKEKKTIFFLITIYNIQQPIAFIHKYISCFIIL
jgi:hypothetical protein